VRLRGACLLLFFVGGCDAIRDTPKRAWGSYRRGADTDLPKASGDPTRRAYTPGVELTEQAGAWVISGGVLDFYQTNTPRQTLEAFLLATRNKRFDVLYQLMPSSDKAKISRAEFEENLSQSWEEFERVAARLEEHINEPIRITGDTAALFFQTGSAELIFELDRWCVVAVR
jgi:hypothetical protein